MKKIILFAILLIGISASAQDSIVSQNCLAQFKYDVNTEIMTLVPSTAINFYDRSEGDIKEWHWDFGDGNTSNEQEPMHIYVHPIFPDGALVKINPYRTVTLTILTNDGCSNFYSETINIYEVFPVDRTICEARFKYNQLVFDSVGQTVTFQFDNYSIGENLTYLWEFDNGKTSTEFAPQVTFDLSRYDRKVCLTISNENGCTHTICDPVYVYDGGGDTDPSFNCFADFWYKVNTEVNPFAPGLALNFYSKVDGDVVKYLWDFGDGSTSNEPNPMHLFNYPIVQDSVLGDPNPFREVCLTITTTTGCEFSICQTIDIYMNTDPAETCNVWYNYYTPDDIYTIPEVVTYKFSPSSDKEIVKLEWRFADGTISNDMEPLKTFNIFDGKTEVCLTISTVDGCSNQLCNVIYFNPDIVDTVVWIEPVCNYTFKYASSYPETASACIGKVTAQVVLNDSLIDTEYYYWSTGLEGPEITNLCPTETYTVTALTTDGCKFSGSFVFNSDGTITEVPINWWITIMGDDSFIEYDVTNSDYTVEWEMCDGSVFYGDSIPLNKFNCGSSEANLVLRDLAGNVVYTEKVAIKGTTSVKKQKNEEQLKLYPNPVGDILNVDFSGEIQITRFEISDLTGRQILKQNVYDGAKKHFNINVSELSRGIYVGKIISGNRIVAVERFIK